MTITVYKFEAEWCGMCKALEPTLMSVVKDFPSIDLKHIDCDENPDGLVELFGIKSLPTLIAVDDKSHEIGRINGLVPKDKLITWFQHLVDNI